MEEHIYAKTVRERFSGQLSRGSHEPDGLACALEAESVVRGRAAARAAARAAGYASAGADADHILRAACEIWIEEAA